MLDFVLYTMIFLAGFGFNFHLATASSSAPPGVSSAVPIAQEYFGMHLQCVVTPCGGNTRYAYPASLGFATVRLWGTISWATLEPQRGVFRWSELDSLVKKASAHGVRSFVFTLGDDPTWASANSGGSCGDWLRGQCYPPDLHAMDDFLTAFVRRECGIVNYYEGWNEPNVPNFWRGTDAQLLTVTQHLYSIARNPANCGCAGAACFPGGGPNPNKMLTPAPNTICCFIARRWTTNWLTLTDKKGLHADIVSFHGYELDPERLGDDVAWLRRQANAHGLAKAEIWDTESSWGKQHPDADDQEASWLMRSYVTHAASGVARFYWYAFGSCSWGALYGPSCGAVPDHWQGMREAGIAYQTIARWLTGATVKDCTHDSDQTWSCTVTKSHGHTAVVMWNSEAVRQIESPAADLLQYRDWQDNVHPLGKTIFVSPMPVLLETE
jgi:polysaccharide biosynthesis protein PslG